MKILSDVESSLNENYSLILNFHNIYRRLSIVILSTIVGSLITLGLFWQLFFIELLPSLTNIQPSTLFLSTFALSLPATLAVFSSIFGIRYLKSRNETKQGFVKVQSALIRRAYILNFELEEATGVSQRDKIFNHLSLVFPQIEKIKKTRTSKGYTNIDQESRSRIKRWLIRNNRIKSFVFKNFDLSLGTPTGVFVLKIINNKTLTFEDIENTVKDIHKKMTITGLGIEQKGVIDRLIFLTNSFDENISKQELDTKMKNLKRDYLIDIIQEKKFGYSTIWIN